jgi:glutathione S-transferase
MKLYYTKGACSLAVRIVINEIGIKAEYEAVDLATKKTENGLDFLQINPKGAVPTIITDENETLTENAVIQQYLTDRYKADNLLPPCGNFQRYRVLEWLNFITTELHKSFGLLFNPQLPTEVKNGIIIPLIKKKFSYIEATLKQNEYLCEKKFTLPDAYLFVMLLWAKNFQIDISENTGISRYFTELQKRASIQQSLKEEKLV